MLVHGKKNTVIEAGNYFRFRRESGENYTKTKQNVDMNNFFLKKEKVKHLDRRECKWTLKFADLVSKK